jgi:hypothetical protein
MAESRMIARSGSRSTPLPLPKSLASDMPSAQSTKTQKMNPYCLLCRGFSNSKAVIQMSSGVIMLVETSNAGFNERGAWKLAAHFTFRFERDIRIEEYMEQEAHVRYES